MADPLYVVGAVASVANIVEYVGKAINTVRELANGYKEADPRLRTLVPQLTALQIAFDKLSHRMNSDRMNSDLEESHNQLVMYLNASMFCCRMLFAKIDALVENLQQKDGRKLDARSKEKLVFSRRNINGLEKLIERQRVSLTLLLTACNCKTMAEQKTLLEKPSTRRAIGRMQSDTESLTVLRESESFKTQITSRLSKLSATFDFDRQLSISRFYERFLRRSMTESLKSQLENCAAKKISMAIDRSLDEDGRRLRKEAQILVLGWGGGRDEIKKQITFAHSNGLTKDERLEYRQTIWKILIDSVKELISAMDRFSIQPDIEANKDFLALLMIIVTDLKPDIMIAKQITDAIRSVWNDPCIPSVLEHLPEFSAQYFFNEAHRILSNRYVPVDADVYQVRARTSARGVQETLITEGHQAMRFFDVGNLRSQRTKWIHFFDSFTVILFVVNLASYDEVLVDDQSSGRTELTESVELFDSIVNSVWFRRTSIILFLANLKLFKEKLAWSALSKHFPNYSGGNDGNRAATYLLQQFSQCSRFQSTLMPYFVELGDPTNIRLIGKAVREIMLRNNL